MKMTPKKLQAKINLENKDDTFACLAWNTDTSNDTLFYNYKWSLVLAVRLGDTYKLAWAAISCCLNN